VSEKTFCFLVYDSRSGSTLLGAKLNEYADIGVSVESNFMRSLILNKNRLSQTVEAHGVWELLASTPRFENLNIEKEKLCRILGDRNGYSVGHVTRCITDLAFLDSKPLCKTCIIKDGANGYLINQIAKELPDAKFLHILRDGRAVLNSKKKTIRPYSRSEKMARDAATCARQWTSLLNHIDNFRTRNLRRCVEIRFEDLVVDEKKQIERIRAFLNMEGSEARDGHISYYTQLPEHERDIHTLVSGPMIEERTDAWKRELDVGSLLVFQYFAQNVLVRNNYELCGETKLSKLLTHGAFMRELMRGVVLRLSDWAGYMVRQRQLKYIIDNKLMRKRDKVGS
jgi:hypothetical protein